MTRGHRAFHRIVWPVLALIVAFGLTMALVLRPPPDQGGAQTTEEPAK